MKVLLVGGPSERKEVAFVRMALDETGYKTLVYEFPSRKGDGTEADALTKLIADEKVDIVLTRRNEYPTHASWKERFGTGLIAHHLASQNIPVVGWVNLQKPMVRNKALCEATMFDAGLPFANDFIYMDPQKRNDNLYGEVLDSRGFTGPQIINPFAKYGVLFVKPNNTGRSFGIKDTNVVHNMDELVARVVELAEEFPRAKLLLSPFYPGREFTVGVIGNKEKIFLPIEVCQKEGYSINKILLEKVKQGGIPEGRVYTKRVDNKKLMSDLAKNAGLVFDALKMQDYTRIDFRRDKQLKLHPIDFNAIPGLKHLESYIVMAAMDAFGANKACKKYSVYGRLVSSIISTAAERWGLKGYDQHPTLFGLPNKLLEA